MQLPRFNMPASCITITTLLMLMTLASSDRLLSQSQNKTQLPPQSPASQLPQVPVIKMKFADFKSLYGKQYSTVAQQAYRQHIFKANIRRLNNHNSNKSRTYNMKANQFLDVTSSEFKQHFTGTYKSDSHSRNVSNAYLHIRQQRAENSADQNQTAKRRHPKHWNRSKGTDEGQDGSRNNTEISISNQTDYKNSSIGVTNSQSRLLLSASNQQSGSSNKSLAPTSKVMIDWAIYAGSIKYQGFCGACYAFTAVDTLAAMNAISKYSFFISLSIQQVIDCSNNGLTFGCSGGYLEGAFSYIQLNGIALEQAYPYTSADTGKAGKCQQPGGPFKLNSFSSITEGDCNAVIKSLSLGPVSAGIAGYNLQFYDTGVFSDCNTLLDHAVVIVGYQSGLGWRIKNSWGTQWGDKGFGWIAEGNTCGICNMAVSIVV